MYKINGDRGDPAAVQAVGDVLTEQRGGDVDIAFDDWNQAAATDWDWSLGFNEFGDCLTCSETVDYCRCEARK